ncbi:sensor histidine kinase [Paraburkholderia fungorum]|nr:sensor histidine kinase [Paraburkholderia fungorum]
MNTMNQSGSPWSEHGRTRQISRARRLNSIRYATFAGGLLAFTLLWAVSTRVSAMPVSVAPIETGIFRLPSVFTSISHIWLILVLAMMIESVALVDLFRSRTAQSRTKRQWPLLAAGSKSENLFSTAEAREQPASNFDSTCAASRTLILDESVSDPRAVIHHAVAQFSQTVTPNGCHPSISVDDSVAPRILADGARLGQIVFHLLSWVARWTEHARIVVAVRADSLNSGAQRIFISVGGIDANAYRIAEARVDSLSSVPAVRSETDKETDPDLARCGLLAQRMRGELRFTNKADREVYVTFSAPFTIEHRHIAAEPSLPGAQPQQPADVAREEDLMDPSVEPFDAHYLHALAEEGIDLPTFLRGWRASMKDDVQRVRTMLKQTDADGVHAALHRLSGAVGLVGAHSLMAALRSAYVAGALAEPAAIEQLALRAEALMNQFDEAADSHWSTLR